MSEDGHRGKPTGAAPPGRALDPASRDVLVRFSFTLVLVVGWYLIWRQDSAIRLSLLALAACVLAVAVGRRERVRAPSLTRWDEAAAWFVLASIAGILGL